MTGTQAPANPACASTMSTINRLGTIRAAPGTSQAKRAVELNAPKSLSWTDSPAGSGWTWSWPPPPPEPPELPLPTWPTGPPPTVGGAESVGDDEGCDDEPGDSPGVGSGLVPGWEALGVGLIPELALGLGRTGDGLGDADERGLGVGLAEGLGVGVGDGEGVGVGIKPGRITNDSGCGPSCGFVQSPLA